MHGLEICWDVSDENQPVFIALLNSSSRSDATATSSNAERIEA
jgi:hypothetical protein